MIIVISAEASALAPRLTQAEGSGVVMGVGKVREDERERQRAKGGFVFATQLCTIQARCGM
jgi:hypothetical protein